MNNRAKLLKDYPNLFDAHLPIFIECPKYQERNEIKNAFNRILPKDAVIIAIEGLDANCVPACVWRVYYELKIEDHDYDVEDGSNVSAPELPNDEASILNFYEKLTRQARFLDLGVTRKYKMGNTAVVEYFPKACECNVQNFNPTTEQPGMCAIKQAFEKLKIHL